MQFDKTDFEGMRTWLFSLPADIRVKRARVICFDLMRYREAYEEIFTYIKAFGGVIKE